ncbi:hypothetical protein [Spirosoma sp. KUDC1026]|uniref:hypothetical protein n=1 Tax=Spirosoma sp. KUDC1026 TaxID=2745947 RepID=UPI00159BB4D3|nr:hypothetical protein [Spirosoma sp. KUDC1026]QKZ12822.1 hypothetical protein HU175_09335 [Spirosoma sp. KUDC1026]
MSDYFWFVQRSSSKESKPEMVPSAAISTVHDASFVCSKKRSRGGSLTVDTGLADMKLDAI